MKKIETKTIEPFDIYPDAKATHLFPRWWHKFIFWKKFIYPGFKIKAKRMKLEYL